MTPSPESRLLSRALTLFGLVFVVGLPILNRAWPGGWASQPEQPAYLHMILSIYFTLGVFLLGLVTVFFIATGYLAPRIGRGSRGAYRWDRGLTAVGVLASVGLVYTGLLHTTVTAPVQEGVVLGGLGLWVATAHARWRGPADSARWRMEHLTSLLAAYTVVWAFIFGLYIRVLPEAARVLIPAVLGTVAILWARRRFGGPSMVQGPPPRP